MRLSDILENDNDHQDALDKTGFWGTKACGCIFMAEDTKRILLAHRSVHVQEPHTWSGIGGAIDPKEDVIEALKREIREETQYSGPVKIEPLYVFKKNTFIYYNFLAIVPNEFKPIADWENQGFKWCEFGKWPSPLHFGLVSLFKDSESIETIKKFAAKNIDEKKKIIEGTAIDRDARSFGLWLSREFDRQYPDKYGKEGVIDHDYTDDSKGRALRYRLLVKKSYLNFLHSIKGVIQQQGWHITVETKINNNCWQVVFEPILTDKVAKSEVFWHVTPKENIEAILHDGLKPKVSRFGFSYPQDRIYLFRSKKNASMMISSLSKRDSRHVDYVTLRVDLRKCKNITIHTDPELSTVAVYATTKIPPQYVSLEKV